MNTIDVVERAVTEHSTVWAAYAKSLHRKIAKLRNANRELEASYRKLAEREKVLTEALEWYVREDDCTNSGYCAEAKARAEAALALHKEDGHKAKDPFKNLPERIQEDELRLFFQNIDD